MEMILLMMKPQNEEKVERMISEHHEPARFRSPLIDFLHKEVNL
jgi:hypothetical protein